MKLMAHGQKSFKASLLSVISLLLFVLLFLHITARPSMAATRIPVGVILDLNSTLGKTINNSLTLAVEDYYSLHKDTDTKIDLVVRNVPQNDVVTAAEILEITIDMQAAARLIDKNHVHAILGPQNSEQARYIVRFGEKVQVPVIWFPITGPSLSPPPSPSSIYSDQGLNCFQFRAIADIVQALGWQSIVPIYEKTEYGSHLLPCLTNVLKGMGIRMDNVTAIDSESTDYAINSTLDTLNSTRTRVFLVHMSMDLGKRFILSAQKKEMLVAGYAWILTQGLSSLTYPQVTIERELYTADLSLILTTFNDQVPLTRYMQGALGVRPMDSNKTKERREKEETFYKRFKSLLTLYGWWAYHTIEALAKALDKPGTLYNGQKICHEIRATTFTGMSGVKFNLSQGQLDQYELEVYNVVGDSERIIGNWSPGKGLFQTQTSYKGGETSDKYKVKDPLWPGYTLDKPPKLRIGVPTRSWFPELMNVNNSSELLMIDGFAYNVFLKAVDVLPFRLNNYEFVALPNMTYDDILCSQMKEKDLDAIIGDFTVVANRINCVDFAFPFLDSSVAMVVRVKDASTNKLILVKPFNRLLWFIFILIFAAATAIIISFLEINKTNGRNRNNQTEEGNKITEFRFNPFLVYKIDVMGINSASKAAGWMVILTSFLFMFIVQVYTASLTSILTQGKTKEPLFMNENELKSSNLLVGYPKGSWVRRLLIEQIGFNPSQLKGLESSREYDEELSRGTQNGGVDAIFGQTRLLTHFLSQYKSRFVMTGPLYQTGGIAFAFPKKSGLVTHFSNAILDVARDVETYRVLMAKSSLPTSIEDLEFKTKSGDKFEL